MVQLRKHNRWSINTQPVSTPSRRIMAKFIVITALLLSASSWQSNTDPVAAAPLHQTSDNDSNDTRLSELLANQENSLTYNGEIEALNRIAVIAEANGMAMTVNTEVGQEVKAGDVLLQIDATILEAQREQAFANLDVAKAQLELLIEEATADEIEAAEVGLEAAEVNYEEVLRGPDPEDLRIAQTDLRQAEAVVRVAQSAYNEVKSSPRIGSLPQSLELERATLNLEAAQARYNKATKASTPTEVANAYAQLVNARNNTKRVTEGPKPAEVRISESRVRQAETELFLAQLALDKAAVRAPIDGIVAGVDVAVGSMVGNGSSVVTLLSHNVKVTIPVEDYRISTLQIDQQAVIRVDAYPEQLFSGIVTSIAPELDMATRTVRLTIRPTDDDSDLLLPGMFATVDLVAEEE